MYKAGRVTPRNVPICVQGHDWSWKISWEPLGFASSPWSCWNVAFIVKLPWGEVGCRLVQQSSAMSMNNVQFSRHVSLVDVLFLNEVGDLRGQASPTVEPPNTQWLTEGFKTLERTRCIYIYMYYMYHIFIVRVYMYLFMYTSLLTKHRVLKSCCNHFTTFHDSDPGPTGQVSRRMVTIMQEAQFDSKKIHMEFIQVSWVFPKIGLPEIGWLKVENPIF